MNKIVLFLCFASVAFSQELDPAKVSEAMGHVIGKNLKSLGVDLDLDAVVKGLKEETDGISSFLDEEIFAIVEQELKKADIFCNGDQINENHSLPATDTTKYW